MTRLQTIRSNWLSWKGRGMFRSERANEVTTGAGIVMALGSGRPDLRATFRRLLRA